MPASALDTRLTSSRTEPASPFADVQITLIDRTVTATEEEEGSDRDSSSPLPRTDSDLALGRRWTKTGLQQQLAQRKYARYREEQSEDEPQQQTSEEAEAPIVEAGRARRGKDKVMGFWKRKKLRQMQDQDAVIDILYENQRGSFFFGIPLFSSKSLLNFDPKPWINAHMKASPVNITNAQVPDPEWEWAWKSWYVDMSRDVDEEGWEYSFSFQNGFAWHGNHPWFHSFVRRRRWLRKRTRKHVHHADGKTSQKHHKESHLLTGEYFTIHASGARSLPSSRANSLAPSSGGLLKTQKEEDDGLEKADIRDTATLLVYLKKASVDREKLVLFRHFVENGGDELYYLAEQIPTIMSLLIFQNSRSRILAILMDNFKAATAHRQEHESHEEEETVQEKQKIDNLLQAIQAADEQVKKLEYWSDIRRIARRGDTVGAVDDSVAWPRHEWQGLDASGPGATLHSEAKEQAISENQLQEDAEMLGTGEAEDPEREPLVADHDAGALADTNDVKTGAHVQQSSDEAWTTAPEEGGQRDKGKGRAA